MANFQRNWFLKDIFTGYCIMRLGNSKNEAKNGNNKGTKELTIDPLSVTQWSLLAVCLFFCAGHWFVVYSRFGGSYTCILLHSHVQWLLLGSYILVPANNVFLFHIRCLSCF